MGKNALQLNEVEGAGLCVKPQNGDEKERRRQKGVEKELESRLRSPIPAEHGDKDGHGNKRELPEGVVEEDIERDEDADHRCLLEKEEEVKLLGPVGDGVPRGEHAEQPRERR